jgi:very-short-patch-repair endonuclease
LTCLICHKRKGCTEGEEKVESVLKTKFPGVEYFPECRALRGFKGSIDFALITERVLIQVDGASHNRPLQYAKAAGPRQPFVDESCNQQALKEGWHLLRIHDKDIGDTQELIELVRGVAHMCAVAARMRNVGVHSSLTFSKDFGKAREAYVGQEEVSALLTM